MKQRIYYGGPIITMEHDAIADFLICEDGKIVSVEYGELSPHWNTENAEFIDLHGAALLPAFIDSHSHIFSYGISLLQLSLKDARSFEEIQHLLAEYIQKNHIENGTWIQASGYDHTQLKEQNHITADILDQVSQENPVVITHQS